MYSENLRIYLFNVGAGDHLMLEFPDGSIGIIDSYYTHELLGLQEAPALTYLKYRVAEEKKKDVPGKVIISFICLSHADIDHVKDINFLFQFIQDEWDYIMLENLWLFGGYSDNFLTLQLEIVALREKLMDKVGKEQRQPIMPSLRRYLECLEQINAFKIFWNKKTGNSEFYFNDFQKIQHYGDKHKYKAFSLGPISRITNQLSNSTSRSLIRQLFEKVQSICYDLNEDTLIDINVNLNRNSLSAILNIRYENQNLIFTGDTTRESFEMSLIDIPKRKDPDDKLFQPIFIKAAHHGARGSTSPIIWQTLLLPEDNENEVCDVPNGEVFIGISAGNKHEHPHLDIFEHVSSCCTHKSYRFFTTNQCSECNIDCTLTPTLDLDDWFEYHGCKIIDRSVYEAFENESGHVRAKGVGIKNLLAYVFEIPKDQKKAVKVYRGLSKRIGAYRECQFKKNNSRYYCKKV